jgi:hypothetical protein
MTPCITSIGYSRQKWRFGGGGACGKRRISRIINRFWRETLADSLASPRKRQFWRLLKAHAG